MFLVTSLADIPTFYTHVQFSKGLGAYLITVSPLTLRLPSTCGILMLVQMREQHRMTWPILCPLHFLTTSTSSSQHLVPLCRRPATEWQGSALPTSRDNQKGPSRIALGWWLTVWISNYPSPLIPPGKTLSTDCSVFRALLQAESKSPIMEFDFSCLPFMACFPPSTVSLLYPLTYFCRITTK